MEYREIFSFWIDCWVVSSWFLPITSSKYHTFQYGGHSDAILDWSHFENIEHFFQLDTTQQSIQHTKIPLYAKFYKCNMKTPTPIEFSNKSLVYIFRSLWVQWVNAKILDRALCILSHSLTNERTYNKARYKIACYIPRILQSW